LPLKQKKLNGILAQFFFLFVCFKQRKRYVERNLNPPLPFVLTSTDSVHQQKEMLLSTAIEGEGTQNRNLLPSVGLSRFHCATHPADALSQLAAGVHP
jgi:hypothetical protein